MRWSAGWSGYIICGTATTGAGSRFGACPLVSLGSATDSIVSAAQNSLKVLGAAFWAFQFNCFFAIMNE
jgi:hypothetical protein